HESLLSGQTLPTQAPPLDWLLIPLGNNAQIATFSKARSLRTSDPNLRVAIDLGGRSEAQIRTYARDRMIKNLAWVQEDGSVSEESL
ncbi:MAG: ATP phosphoribosyltransferase regulatory subunit, partial [bacterium]